MSAESHPTMLSWGDFGHVSFFATIWNDNYMKIYMFNVKLVNILLKKFHRVLSCGFQQNEKRNIADWWFLSIYDVTKRGLSILPVCKNISVALRDWGFKWYHENCKTKDFYSSELKELASKR